MRRTMGALRQKHPRSAGAAGTSGPGAGDARAFLVERVLAWQHRHPLARRLHPQQVVAEFDALLAELAQSRRTGHAHNAA